MTAPDHPRLVRAARRLTKSPTFRWLGRHVIPPVDRLLHRVSGGRLHLSDSVIPTLVLTTTGRRSGRPRHTPLAFVEEPRGFLVVGSNWGQEHHPAWTHNLLAEPEAVVEAGGERHEVTARLLDGAEREAAWEALTARWPSFDDYLELAEGRPLRVFLLAPRA